MRRPDERRAVAHRGVGQTFPVRGPAEPDPLLQSASRGARGAARSRRRVGSASTPTSATQRYPRPWTVLMTFCWMPSSPTTRRAALMRLVSVDSLTKRSPQTVSSSSVLGTTRDRWARRWLRTSKTWGWTCCGSPSRSRRNRSVSRTTSPNEYRMRSIVTGTHVEGTGQPGRGSLRPSELPPGVEAGRGGDVDPVAHAGGTATGTSWPPAATSRRSTGSAHGCGASTNVPQWIGRSSPPRSRGGPRPPPRGHVDVGPRWVVGADRHERGVEGPVLGADLGVAVEVAGVAAVEDPPCSARR